MRSKKPGCRSVRLGVAFAATLWGGSALAGVPVPVGSVGYGPLGAEGIPLLSDVGLMLLVGLMAVIAFRVLRSRSAGRPLASVVALGILVAGGMASGRVEQVAYALAGVSLSSAAGGSADILATGTDVPVQNNTAVNLKILGVQATPPNTVGVPSSSACVAGVTVLAPAASCNVLINLPG